MTHHEDEQRQLTELYQNRFSGCELEDKRVLWDVLCRKAFQQYVPVDGAVVDLGAGNCEFVNAIRARRRVAVDLNPETKLHARPDVEVLITRAHEMTELEDSSIDTVFTSNFFEHLPTKQALLETLAECRRVTKPGGRLVVLMPNARYLGGRYWDYFDHHIPLTDQSLGEALRLSAYQVDRVVPRFVPYTVKDSRLRVRASLVGAYLNMPFVWPLLGRQMLLVASKP